MAPITKPIQPDNISNLQASQFQVVFSRIPLLVYQVQTVSIPGASTNALIRPTPFVDLKVPGNKLQYNDLVISFILDRDLRSWNELYNWMTGFAFPDSFSEYQQMLRTDSSPYSDATLMVNTNQNNQNLKYVFKDCWPVQLGQVDMSTLIDANEPVVSTATFKFNRMDVVYIPA